MAKKSEHCKGACSFNRHCRVLANSTHFRSSYLSIFFLKWGHAGDFQFCFYVTCTYIMNVKLIRFVLAQLKKDWFPRTLVYQSLIKAIFIKFFKDKVIKLFLFRKQFMKLLDFFISFIVYVILWIPFIRIGIATTRIRLCFPCHLIFIRVTKFVTDQVTWFLGKSCQNELMRSNNSDVKVSGYNCYELEARANNCENKAPV